MKPISEWGEITMAFVVVISLLLIPILTWAIRPAQAWSIPLPTDPALRAIEQRVAALEREVKSLENDLLAAKVKHYGLDNRVQALEGGPPKPGTLPPAPGTMESDK